jgi:LmbE family N-acetylglucosaminyl deacetylase
MRAALLPSRRERAARILHCLSSRAGREYKTIARTLWVCGRPALLAAFFALVGAGCADNSHHDEEVGVVVLAPHPDDETIGFGGLIRDAVRQNRGVHVVVVTDGDAYVDACWFWKNGCPRDSSCNGPAPSECSPVDVAEFGRVRRQETLAAMRLLGLPEENVEFWGYPDAKLAMMRAHPDSIVDAWTPNRFSETGKSLCGRSVEQDVRAVLRRYPDATFYTTHIEDHHADHRALAGYLQDARAARVLETGHLQPAWWAVIHEPHSGRDLRWPPPICTWETDYHRREERYTPTAGLPPPEGMGGAPSTYVMQPEMWDPALRTPPLMREALELYKTQYGAVVRGGAAPPQRFIGVMDDSGYLLAFVKRNHLYWEAAAP